MEGNSWFRLGTIFAMVVASAYVLSPTIVSVVEGPEARLEEKAGSVKAPSSRGPVTEVAFVAADPSQAEAAAEALATRLQNGGVPTQRVAVENGQVVVHLGAGGRADRIAQIAAVPGVQRILLGGETPAVVDEAPPADATPTEAKVRSIEESYIIVEGLAIDSAAILLVVVDEAVVAVGSSPTANDDGSVRFSVTAASADLSAKLGGPLPTALTVVPEKVEPVAVAQKPKSKAQKVFPDWFVAALPDTEMNLGLDLQGGIDITLQVELEEAVRAELGRNAKTLEVAAKADGLAVEAARRDPVDPMLVIRGTVPLTDLRAFVAKRFRGYEFVGTDNINGVDEHRFAMNEEARKAIETAATDAVLETLRKRIDATGVKEPSIVKKGEGRVGIQLPGEVDLQQAIDAIGTTAVLEFRLVDEEFDATTLSQAITAAREALPEDQLYDAEMFNRWLHETKRIPDDRVVVWEGEEQRAGAPEVNPSNAIVVRDEVMLGGNDVADAGVKWDQNQTPYVQLEFKTQGAQSFCTVTGENIGKRFAIILDEQIRSAPVIRSRICGGPASIEMGDSVGALNEANTLALVLRTGSLNAPVSIGEVRTVGSTLGKDAIQQGTMGTLIGSCLVFIFMTLWYRWSGIIANVTLAMNVIIMLAMLAMFGATLTLPGIAGLALTVGMAVDANIIIYERIRDELKLGVNARKAIDMGFDKAFTAILDSNLNHGISGVVLFSYGTGPIKGFAVTLIVGIVTTLITALFMTRTFMDILGRKSTQRLSI